MIIVHFICQFIPTSFDWFNPIVITAPEELRLGHFLPVAIRIDVLHPLDQVTVGIKKSADIRSQFTYALMQNIR
jgi:hypothetical protein